MTWEVQHLGQLRHSILYAQHAASFEKQNGKYYKLYTVGVFRTTTNSTVKIKMER